MQSHPSSLLALSFLAAAGLSTHVERATCTGAQQGGYCCNGSIFKKDNSNDISDGNLICCDGDPHVQINFGANAPTSCTAGTEIPLTKASGGSTSQSTGSSDRSSAAGAAESSASGSSPSALPSSSANGAAGAVITTAPLAGAAALVGGIILGL